MDVALHDGQSRVFMSPAKNRVLVCGRRFGKSSLGIWELFARSLTYPGDCRNELISPVCLGIMPTLSQAKQVLWKPLLRIAETLIPHLIHSINRTDFTINIKGGKPPIIIRGANDSNGDRLRGLRVYFCLADEYQDIRPTTYDEVVEPAMKDTVGSRTLFTGTPKGKINHFYKLAEKAEHSPEYQYFNMPTWTNPCISKEEVDKSRAILPPRVFRQEYEASWEDFPGKIYTELGSQHRLEELPSRWYPDMTVMGIDWGDYHPALVVLGRNDKKWYFLEAWSPGSERDSQPIPETQIRHQMSRLKKKWDISHAYADPSRASSILAAREVIPRTVAGYNRIEEGIAQVHSLISMDSLLFTKELHDKAIPDSLDGHLGYQLLEAYHRVTDKNGYITEEPADGYFSHVNDALRYALAVKSK